MISAEEVLSGGSRPVQRRTMLKALGTAGAVLGLSACTDTSSQSPTSTAAPTTAPPGTTLPGTTTAESTTAAPSTAVPAPVAETGEITAAGVDRALDALPGIIERTVAATGIPGLAMAVVYDGEVRYSEGTGVRAVGKPEKVDSDTVFYLASVSKQLSSTVIAAALTQGLGDFNWDSTLASQLPKFTLADPWVGSHVTIADMFSHRSGLPDHAGNILEDMGFDRDEVIARLATYPLKPFRDNYEYTNYGLTAGAEAAAAAAGKPWAALADDILFTPLGMASTSFTYADLRSRTNRVALHQKSDGSYVARPDADYEPQAPAGSASSSVRDMAQWLTMLLAAGEYKGSTLIDADQLSRTWTQTAMSKPPAAIGQPASFYGLGWNVKFEPTGELSVSHSGAFGRGAATMVTAYPVNNLALVVLTNAAPLGAAEAIGAEFMDFVRHGEAQQGWLKVIGPYFDEKPTADQEKYSQPAESATPARSLSSYAGTYDNPTYGPMIVTAAGDALSLTVGPNREKHTLEHYSGDDFFFETTGEDASGLSGVVFAGSPKLTSVTVGAWNHNELGTFTRK